MTSIDSSENLETYCLIWLDSYVNSSSDNRRAQQQLQKIIHNLLTFEDDQSFLQYLNNLSNNSRLILIVSGRFGRLIVPKIVQYRQVTSIYVYCMDKRANEQWSKQYLKVKQVVTHLDELIRTIEQDYIQQQDCQINECLSIKIDDELLRFQLLIDGLIRLKSYELVERFELIAFCKKYYKTNSSELTIIKEFQSTYLPDRALSWFTRHAFVSRLLIKAFRDENLDLLCKYRFFLRHLACQLGQSKPMTSTCVYRSQLMSKDELNVLKNSIGKMISFDTFVRANYDEKQCRSLLISNNYLEKVLFEIYIDPKLRRIRPFGNIPSKTNELLFMIGSIFSIDDIRLEKEQISKVKLTLRSLDHPSLKSLVQRIKTDLPVGEINLLQFGKLLYRIEKFEFCRKYFCQHLNQLPDNHRDISICYQYLGLLAEMKKNFPLSLKWYKQALRTCEQTTLPEIYHSMGDVYAKINDYKRAIKFYEQAMITFGDDPQSIIKCLNDLGAVYDMRKDYTQAIVCYENALTMSNDPETIFILRNIGNTYELKEDYKQAEKYYEKALKSNEKSLSIDEIYIKDLQTSLRRVSSKN